MSEPEEDNLIKYWKMKSLQFNEKASRNKLIIMVLGTVICIMAVLMAVILSTRGTRKGQDDPSSGRQSAPSLETEILPSAEPEKRQVPVTIEGMPTKLSREYVLLVLAKPGTLKIDSTVLEALVENRLNGAGYTRLRKADDRDRNGVAPLVIVEVSQLTINKGINAAYTVSFGAGADTWLTHKVNNFGTFFQQSDFGWAGVSSNYMASIKDSIDSMAIKFINRYNHLLEQQDKLGQRVD